MSMRRARATVATNARLEVYGGLRLPDEVLYALAEELRSGALPFTYNHDALRPMRTANFAAGVENADGGSLQVWAEFDIEEEDWAYMSSELDRYGVRGGVSWSMTVNPVIVGGNGDQASVRISADAGYFDPEQVVQDVAQLGALQPVEVSEIYQFAAIPPALVLIAIKQTSKLWRDLLVGGSSSVGGAALYDLLKRMLRPRHRYEDKTVATMSSLDFRVEEPARVIDLHLRTDDPDVLRGCN